MKATQIIELLKFSETEEIENIVRMTPTDETTQFSHYPDNLWVNSSGLIPFLEIVKEYDTSFYEKIKNKWFCVKVRVTRAKRKKILVQLLGGECRSCGYNKEMTALEFHHVDPGTKKFSVCNRLNTWSEKKFLELVMPEAKKCQLLCANCHRELHASLISAVLSES